jgi:hypothetical protein
MWVLSFLGCGGAPDREGCDRLVVVDGYRESYDPDGTCWSTFAPGECEAQCEQILTELYVEFDHEPTCDPVPVTGEPLLEEGDFWDRYNGGWCGKYEDCGGTGRCYDRGPCSEGETFDPLAGEACLAAGFTCGPYSQVYADDACDRVCDG